MRVDRCVCRGMSFEELKRLAKERSLDYEGLSVCTGCGTGCTLCEPYVRRMLRTGETSFAPGLTDPERPSPPFERR
jgi:bacterioferritin-associated ferredoxin